MCVPTESLARYTLGERIIPGRFTAPPKFVQSRRISKLMKIQEKLRYLEDRWDEQVARDLDPPELLRYRSNVLGSDLRITNFGGGNTSSKIEGIDPLDGSCQTALWIKGSGGDIGSIQRNGFATLYQSKLQGLANRYRGVEFEDEMVEMYPLCAFGNNTVAASIDTPLHGFLPFEHIDHLHPDWGIALGGFGEWPRKDGRVQPALWASLDLAAVAASGIRAGDDAARRGEAKIRVAMASCSAGTACSPGEARSANAT